MLGVTGSIKDKLHENFGRKGFSVRYYSSENYVMVIGPKHGPKLEAIYNTVKDFPVEIVIFKADVEMFIRKYKNGNIILL